jgi:hypothetical protein
MPADGSNGRTSMPCWLAGLKHVALPIKQRQHWKSIIWCTTSFTVMQSFFDWMYTWWSCAVTGCVINGLAYFQIAPTIAAAHDLKRYLDKVCHFDTRSASPPCATPASPCRNIAYAAKYMSAHLCFYPSTVTSHQRNTRRPHLNARTEVLDNELPVARPPNVCSP